MPAKPTQFKRPKTVKSDDAMNRLIQPSAATQTFGILAMRGAGKTNSGRAMAERMFDLKIPFVAIDPVGSWWGLRASRDGKSPGLPIPVFGGKHGDIPLDVAAATVVADLIVERRLSCVLDISSFASEGDKKKFLLAFALRLYLKNEDPLHLFLEEADDYCPQRPMRDEAYLLRAWENIVRRGRARGLGITLITQRSAALAKMVLTQIETLIVLRTTSPQDRKAIEAWVTYHAASAEILESLAGLEDGEAWIWSPHYLKQTFRMRFPMSRTFDSGATPKNVRAGERRDPATMADIDLAELREKMQATIAKAHAEDPKELRRRIAELEKQLRAAPKPAAQEPKWDAAREREIRLSAVRVFNEQRVQPLLNQVYAKLLHEAKSIEQAQANLALGMKEIQRLVAQNRAPVPMPLMTPEPFTSAVAALKDSDTNAQVLSAAQRKILTALAQTPTGIPNAQRLAALSGYTVNGHFKNMVGQLRTAGHVTPAGTLPIQITEDGLKALGPFDPLPTGEELRQYWLRRVGTSKARLLEALFKRYPEPLTTPELAEHANYTVNGHFKNMLGSLRTMGLVTPGGTPLKAMDYLFEE
jgi:uncharacterized protein